MLATSSWQWAWFLFPFIKEYFRTGLFYLVAFVGETKCLEGKDSKNNVWSHSKAISPFYFLPLEKKKSIFLVFAIGNSSQIQPIQKLPNFLLLLWPADISCWHWAWMELSVNKITMTITVQVKPLNEWG